jgi:hypothetical protein
MRAIEQTLRDPIRRARWAVQSSILSWRDPEALSFYRRVLMEAYRPNNAIDLAPRLNVFYVSNPKVASTRIRAALAALQGRDLVSNWQADRNWEVHKRSRSGLKAPRHDIREFYRLATDPSVLRFSFVRNPYDRMVSCWLDQYREKPLVHGRDVYIDTYLERRKEVDPSLPAGASETLSFSQFVEFALATDDLVRTDVSMHWHPQTKILHIPGMKLDFIGKIENFAADFNRVLDFVNASPELRAKLIEPFHFSKRKPVSEYLTPPLAERIYAAYEEDFDRYGYPKTLPG